MLLSCLLLLLGTAALCHGGDGRSVDVTIANGTVTGSAETADGREVWQFLGIPFAQPPLGSLRFRQPQPIREKWSAPLAANSPARGCLQLTIDFIVFPKHLKANYSEDCLYLNVWTPSLSRDKKKSVMVWIHGGGFFFGEALPYFNGKALAAIGDVVVVVVQYRLGLLGFARLDDRLVPGNMGLLDQQTALRWVHENIAQFGGDPDSVTLFGESAGSASVSMHLLSAESVRYFRRGIMQSGSALAYWAINPNAEAVEALSRQTASTYLNCRQESADDLLKCLQSKSESEMLNAVIKFTADRPIITGNLAPTVDGQFFSTSPEEILSSGKIPRREVIIGVTDDEGSVIVKVAAAKWFSMLNIATPTSDHCNASFVRWALSQFIPNYPHYPSEMSAVARDVLFVRSLSYTDGKHGHFNPRKLSDAVGNYMFYCSVGRHADALRSLHDGVYFYEFAHKPSTPLRDDIPTPVFGATHFDDVPFVFAHPLVYPHLEKTMTADEVLLSRRIIADFTAFARTGRPQDPNWRPYTLKGKEFYRYDIASSLQKGGVRRDECVFWDRVLPLLNGVSCRKDADSKCTLSTPTAATPTGGGRLRSDEL